MCEEKPEQDIWEEETVRESTPDDLESVPENGAGQISAPISRSALPNNFETPQNYTHGNGNQQFFSVFSATYHHSHDEQRIPPPSVPLPQGYPGYTPYHAPYFTEQSPFHTQQNRLNSLNTFPPQVLPQPQPPQAHHYHQQNRHPLPPPPSTFKTHHPDNTEEKKKPKGPPERQLGVNTFARISSLGVFPWIPQRAPSCHTDVGSMLNIPEPPARPVNPILDVNPVYAEDPLISRVRGMLPWVSPEQKEEVTNHLVVEARNWIARNSVLGPPRFSDVELRAAAAEFLVSDDDDDEEDDDDEMQEHTRHDHLDDERNGDFQDDI